MTTGVSQRRSGSIWSIVLVKSPRSIGVHPQHALGAGLVPGPRLPVVPGHRSGLPGERYQRRRDGDGRDDPGHRRPPGDLQCAEREAQPAAPQRPTADDPAVGSSRWAKVSPTARASSAGVSTGSGPRPVTGQCRDESGRCEHDDGQVDHSERPARAAATTRRNSAEIGCCTTARTCRRRRASATTTSHEQRGRHSPRQLDRCTVVEPGSPHDQQQRESSTDPAMSPSQHRRTQLDRQRPSGTPCAGSPQPR